MADCKLQAPSEHGAKPYQPPHLIRYGAVTELTQAGGSGPSESANWPTCATDNTRKVNSSCVPP